MTEYQTCGHPLECSDKDVRIRALSKLVEDQSRALEELRRTYNQQAEVLEEVFRIINTFFRGD